MEKLDNIDNEPWLSRNRFKILLIKYLSSENRKNIYDEILAFLANLLSYPIKFLSEEKLEIFQDLNFHSSVLDYSQKESRNVFLKSNSQNLNKLLCDHNLLNFSHYVEIPNSNFKSNLTFFSSVFYAYLIRLISQEDKFSEVIAIIQSELIEDLMNFVQDSNLISNYLREKITQILTDFISIQNFSELYEMLNSRVFLLYMGILTKILIFADLNSFVVKNDSSITNDEVVNLFMALIDDKVKISLPLFKGLCEVANRVFLLKESVLVFDPLFSFFELESAKQVKINNMTRIINSLSDKIDQEDQKLYFYVKNLSSSRILVNSKEYLNIKKIFQESEWDNNEDILCEESDNSLAKENINLDQNNGDDVSKETELENDMIFLRSQFKLKLQKEKNFNQDIFDLFFKFKLEAEIKEVLNDSSKENSNKKLTECCLEKKSYGTYSLLGCNHTFCNQCLIRYIRVKSNNHFLLSYFDCATQRRAIKCQVEHCGNYISKVDVKNILPEIMLDHIWQKFNDKCEGIREKVDSFAEDDDELSVNKFPCVVCSKVEPDFNKHYLCSATFYTKQGEFTDYHAICDTCANMIYVSHQNSSQKLLCPVACCSQEIQSAIEILLKTK
jgi:hypothetical protein